MTVGESWVYQGRQGHGWFGTGTAPKSDPSSNAAGANDLFRLANAGQHVDYVASSIIMHVSRNDRSRWDAAASDSARNNLKTAVIAWYGASRLSRDAFRAQFLDIYTSDEIVDRLRRATRGMVEGKTYDELAKAGDDLAAAAQKVGADSWPRFLANASHRAIEAVTHGNVSGVMKANASGTDGEQVVAMGGLALLLYLISGWKPERLQPHTAPSRPTILQQQGPRDASLTPGQTASAATAPNGLPADLAKPGEATLSSGWRKYTLDGDKKGGGGHGPGRNIPGKSESPSDWSDDKVIEAVKDVANDPASDRLPADGSRTAVRGTRDGVDIEAIIGRDGQAIVTAYPTNIPPNEGP